MKNISLFIIVDYAFKIVLLFLINFIWIYYFYNKLALSIFLSIIFSLALMIIYNKIFQNKKNKKISSINEEQKILDITNTFLVMQENEILDFFYNLVSTKHKCKVINNYLEIITDEDPIILYPIFKSENLVLDDILPVYKKVKNLNIKKMIILTNKYEKILDLSYFNFKVKILNNKDTYYQLIKLYEFYPKIIIKNKINSKKSFNDLLSIALNKSKSKGYFISALFIIFASFFVRYKIYYLIFSSFLLFLALFCRINLQFNKIEKKGIFD